MKRTLTLLLLLTMISLSALADDLPIIRDEAGLLTEEEEQALYQDMLPLCEYGTPMFWTTNESGHYEYLAEDFYKRQIGTANGTLFAINMYSRQLTVHTDGALQRVITSAEAASITDNVFRLARDGRYYDCAKGVFGQIGRLLRGEKIARPMKLVSSLFLAAALALMAVYLYISARYEQHEGVGKVKTAVPASVLSAAAFTAVIATTQKKMTRQVKTDLSSGSGGSHGGGGFSGGGGGGGHSGSSGSHGF